MLRSPESAPLCRSNPCRKWPPHDQGLFGRPAPFPTLGKLAAAALALDAAAAAAAAARSSCGNFGPGSVVEPGAPGESRPFGRSQLGRGRGSCANCGFCVCIDGNDGRVCCCCCGDRSGAGDRSFVVLEGVGCCGRGLLIGGRPPVGNAVGNRVWRIGGRLEGVLGECEEEDGGQGLFPLRPPGGPGMTGGAGTRAAAGRYDDV